MSDKNVEYIPDYILEYILDLDFKAITQTASVHVQLSAFFNIAMY